MREDQRKRLDDLSERLAEQAIGDADPDNWDGANQLPIDMDKETRGNAVWCRKLALGTLAVLASVERVRETQPAPGEEEPNIEKDIERAEKDARAMLERVVEGVKVGRRRAKS